MQTKKHTQCAGLVYFIIIQHSFITIGGRARGAGKPPTSTNYCIPVGKLFSQSAKHELDRKEKLKYLLRIIGEIWGNLRKH